MRLLQLPPIFWAEEESDCCERQLCGPMRSFTVRAPRPLALPSRVVLRPRLFGGRGGCPTPYQDWNKRAAEHTRLGRCLGALLDSLGAP